MAEETTETTETTGAGDGQTGAGAGAGDPAQGADGGTQDKGAGSTIATAGSEAAGKAAEGGEKAAAADWRSSLPDDLKKSAEKFAAPGDLLKSYNELHTRLEKSVVLPGKDASDKEVSAWRKAMGIPDAAEGYEAKVPENLPERYQSDEAGQARQGEFLKAMHAVGAPQAVVSKALEWYYGELKAIDAAQETAKQEALETATAALRKDWAGEGEYERNEAYAKRAASEFGSEGLVDLLENAEIDGVKLGNHPAFLKAFAQIGRRMGEELPLVGHGGEQQVSNIQKRIDEIHALPPDQYNNPRTQEELQGLYSKLYGDAPADGRAA